MNTTTATPRRSLFRTEEPEWLVWLLVIALLAVGLIVRSVVTGRTQRISQGNVALSAPAGWGALASDDPQQLIRISEPLESTVFPATVTVTQLPLAEMIDDAEASLGDLAFKWTNQQSQDLLSYKVLSIEPSKVKDQDAVKINYVYLTEPELGGPGALPIVAEGQDVLVKQGANLTIASFLADSDVYGEMTRVWNRILNSLELS